MANLNRRRLRVVQKDKKKQQQALVHQIHDDNRLLMAIINAVLLRNNGQYRISPLEMKQIGADMQNLKNFQTRVDASTAEVIIEWEGARTLIIQQTNLIQRPD